MRKEFIAFLKAIDANTGLSVVPRDVEPYVDKLLENATIIPLREGGVLNAFIAYYDNQEDSKIAYLSMLAVSSMARGQGIGSQLLDASIEKLKQKGFRGYRLEVLKSNDKAIRIYDKFGFKVIGEDGQMYKMEKTLV
ncbi:N-acetyltransferase [Mangrovimonas sp. TPBH4]|uniref:GNAT family N-acetyltransferase n=1 Tax=Mangrovimonas sp. TPBH4 TaxID=1645914 RepID=UPI0006B5991B|nr:GNAT family N-acetyltransferase [Mangrovimonas sp. TPBH4]